MSKKIDRRKFIKGAAITGAGLVAGGGLLYGRRALADLLAGDYADVDRAIRDHKDGALSDEDVQATVEAYMTEGEPSPGVARVVHVHDPDATSWDGSGWYGDAVNQSVVDTMMQTGLQQLTGQSSWGSIWGTLFTQVQPSGYQTGQKIAIKVSFNNSTCDDSDNKIDALPQVAKALIASLKQAGVQEQDIWLYDATTGGRHIPDRFRTPILGDYPGVSFYGKGECSGVQPAEFSDSHASLRVSFSDPDGNLTARLLPHLLYDATYLINMPILKQHGIHPVSLGFKNHFGSLDNISRGGDNSLHAYISPSNSLYDSNYSPMVDLYNNQNIKNKTMLTIGDGLYAAPGATQAPTQWSTFGEDYPNSLFFALDPVAVDCVMTDFVVTEWTWIKAHAHDYLFCAQEAGLGTCEGTRSNPGGDPWQVPYGSGYEDIEYIRVTP